MSEHLINGKHVWLKDSLKVKDAATLPKMLQSLDALDFNTQIPLLTLLVERWEFDGDPTDVTAYGELDLFTEFALLVGLAGDIIKNRMAASQATRVETKN